MTGSVRLQGYGEFDEVLGWSMTALFVVNHGIRLLSPWSWVSRRDQGTLFLVRESFKKNLQCVIHAFHHGVPPEVCRCTRPFERPHL